MFCCLQLLDIEKQRCSITCSVNLLFVTQALQDPPLSSSTIRSYMYCTSKVRKHEIILNCFDLNQNFICPWSIFEKNFDYFPWIFTRISMFKHFRGD